jgi:hypothetical protein
MHYIRFLRTWRDNIKKVSHGASQSEKMQKGKKTSSTITIQSHLSHPPNSLAHFALRISRLTSSPSTVHASTPPTLSTISSSHLSSVSSSFLLFFLGGGGGGARLPEYGGAMRDSGREDLR